MDGALLARIRWRRRGAWLWPAFALFTAFDAAVGHALPPTGESQSVVAAALLGAVLNLVGVVLLSRPLGAAIRRVRGDLPAVVARNYAGTWIVLAIALALVIAGVAHRPAIQADQRAMDDATVRAQAWIGDRAPAPFRRNLARVDTYAIQPGSIYRACVPSDDGRTYCVIVKTHLPFASSVSFAGYEPNALFAQGTG